MNSELVNFISPLKDATHTPHGDDNFFQLVHLLQFSVKDAPHTPHGDDNFLNKKSRRESIDATHTPHGDENTKPSDCA